MTLEEIIEHLKLEPHPEGGYFRETYRSEGIIPQTVLGKSFDGERNYSTAIYFLLTSDNFSAFHKVAQDEFWHFHIGAPIELHMINPKGEHSHIIIGNNMLNGETPQFVVPGGYWFAAQIMEQNSFALVSCTVSPGFDFADFDLAKRSELTKQFPQHSQLVEQFTRVE